MVEAGGAEFGFESGLGCVLIGLRPEVAGGGVAVADVGDAFGRGECFDGGGGCGDEEVDGLELMAGVEFAGELLDCFGVAGEEPTAERFWEMVERRSGAGDGVDGGGDWVARIEHGVELGDSVVGVEEMGGDGVEDEFASTTGDEPVVGEGDCGFGVGGGHNCGRRME